MLEQTVIDLSEHRLQKSKSLLKQAEYLLNNQMYEIDRWKKGNLKHKVVT